MEEQKPGVQPDSDHVDVERHEPQTQHVAVNAQLLPTQYAVAEADSPELGEVVLVDLIVPSGKFEVILSPDSAEKMGQAMVERARATKSGLRPASAADLAKIEKARSKGGTRRRSRQGPPRR